jgi:hypothetical protein
MVRRIAALLGEQFRPEFMAEVCQDCRGLPWS